MSTKLLPFVIVVSFRLENVLKLLKKNKHSLFERLEKQILKIVKQPFLGKPLRNVLRNYRRVHINSYVLIYEVRNNEIRLLDFDHHDKIYKKY